MGHRAYQRRLRFPLRLLSRIGAGGMGEVWLAEDTQLPRKVAVKLLPRAAAGDPGRSPACCARRRPRRPWTTRRW